MYIQIKTLRAVMVLGVFFCNSNNNNKENKEYDTQHKTRTKRKHNNS
jgi:hypothetical protein